ncbi:O-acetyl-ADP-ribose deacetylase [Paenibacillus xanthanilyticus]|uniref:O-acetyl-ADP-ribose deacetylase n=1 Tax=Paenibacillus xanthanilyticus TaxID=1783531 RepID=A0ABV8K868_9BACL
MEASITINRTVLTVVRGDITKIPADVIVNAANTSLLGGGGVDGAIHRAGGPEILDACRRIRAQQGGCPVGEAVITTAGQLPAQYVVHTVGPVWNGGDDDEAEKLRDCYRNSLTLAIEHGAASIAFPNISTGIYSFPKLLAAEIALDAVAEYLCELADDAPAPKRIIFVCYDAENELIYRETLGNCS